MSNQPQFQPPGNLKAIRLDRHRQVAGQVFAHLRSQIVSLDLEPGTALSRPALARLFDVSRTPIRDALLRLEHENLVAVYPQSSTLVTPIDLAQAHETQFLRVALETEVVRTLALVPGKYDLAPAEQYLEQMNAAWEDDQDYHTFRLRDLAFHGSFYIATGHEQLWELILQRSGNIDRLRNLQLPTPGTAAEIMGEHLELLSALKAGNSEKAQNVLRHHLGGALRSVDQIKADFPNYFRD